MSELATPPPAVNNPDDASATMSKALTFIVNTVINCQQRGGYSLEEAMAIHTATSYFGSQGRDPRQDADLGTKHLTLLVRMLEKSQSLGKLTLEEAWTAYNAIQLFTHSAPAPASASTSAPASVHAETTAELSRIVTA